MVGQLRLLVESSSLRPFWASSVCVRLLLAIAAGQGYTDFTKITHRVILLQNRGANEKIRTPDLRITNAPLYRLSYVGVTCLTTTIAIKDKSSVCQSTKEQLGAISYSV